MGWQAHRIGDQFILGPGPQAGPQSQQMGNADWSGERGWSPGSVMTTNPSFMLLGRTLSTGSPVSCGDCPVVRDGESTVGCYPGWMVRQWPAYDDEYWFSTVGWNPGCDRRCENRLQNSVGFSPDWFRRDWLLCSWTRWPEFPPDEFFRRTSFPPDERVTIYGWPPLASSLVRARSVTGSFRFGSSHRLVRSCLCSTVLSLRWRVQMFHSVVIFKRQSAEVRLTFALQVGHWTLRYICFYPVLLWFW